MKKTILTLLATALILPLAAQDASTNPENAGKQKEGVEGLAPWQQDFLNLPEEKRKEFVQHTQRARELFVQKRIFEAIDEATKAKAIFDGSPDIENLLGGCEVEFRNFEAALEHFRRAEALTPDSVLVKFNLAEVYFVSKQWQKSLDMIDDILAKLDATGDEKAKISMGRLMEFKRLLCLIKLDRIDEARKLAQKYDIFDDSPFPYYAEAAIQFHDGNILEAEAAMARGNRIFEDPGLLGSWQDTLMEFGYIKSFYGGDIEDAGTAPSPNVVAPDLDGLGE